MEPITNIAATGLSGLAEYSLAGILLMLLLVGGAFVARWFMNAFKDCHESTKQVVEKNTEALHGVQLALTKLEGKIK